MRALSSWIRADARRRLRALLVLTALVSISSGVVLAGIVGARRDGTAVARLAAKSRTLTVMAVPNTPGFDWKRIRALPQVETVGEFALTGFGVKGYGTSAGSFPAASVELYTKVESGVVLEGRRADPTRVDEVMISPKAKTKRHMRVGQRLTLQTFSAKQLEEFDTEGVEPAGPTQDATIVGVFKTPFGATDDSGAVFTTHAFWERYQEHLVSPEFSVVNALIILRGGDRDIPVLQRELDAVAGHAVDLIAASDGLKHDQHTTALERGALLAFALAAALAALVLVGQAAVRLVNAAAIDMPTLQAIGATSRQRAGALALAPAVALLASAGGALVVAYALSGYFPIGLGRLYEPNPGRGIDWTVVGPGLAVVVIGGTLALIGIALWQVRRENAPDRTRRSRLVAAAGAGGVPVTALLGMRLALEPGSGRSRVPARPAIIGAMIGVLGVVGAMTFSVGLDRAGSDAGLYGQHFDAGFGQFPVTDPVPPDTLAKLIDSPDVAVVNETRISVEDIDGRGVALMTLDGLKGEMEVTTVSGRVPVSASEIMLAPEDRKALGADVGDTLRVGPKHERFRVVGTGFTAWSPHTSYVEGAWVTRDGLKRLVATDDDLKFHNFLVGFRPGLDRETTIERVSKRTGIPLESASDLEPEDMKNLQGVRNVPLALGVFLVLLAIAAVGRALASGVRRRRFDMGVLRTFGFTRAQARLTIAWQATTLAVVGLIVGVPLGVILGRAVWHNVAVSTPMHYVAPVAALAVVLVWPLAVLVANALAAWPARIAARLRPVDVLRVE